MSPIPDKFRKMSTARLEHVMANGAMVRDRKMATREYDRRIDKKAATLMEKSSSKTNGVSVHIQIQGLVDRTAAELSEVLTRVLTQALDQIRIPRP